MKAGPRAAASNKANKQIPGDPITGDKDRGKKRDSEPVGRATTGQAAPVRAGTEEPHTHHGKNAGCIPDDKLCGTKSATVARDNTH